QVLDRVDRARVARQPCCVVDAGQVLDSGRDLDAAEVGATEADAEIAGGRFEGEGDLVARVKADSRAGNRPSKRPLYVHQALWRGNEDCHVSNHGTEPS